MLPTSQESKEITIMRVIISMNKKILLIALDFNIEIIHLF